MIDSFPDLYRVSTDDGETADYTLTGVISLDTGDEFAFQPDTAEVEIIGDSRLPLGKVTMVTNRQGEVYLFPSNRLADARPVTEGELLGLAFDYLACGPFVTPAEFIHTNDQVNAMRLLLGLTADAPIAAPESPVEPPKRPAPSDTPPVAKAATDEAATSPKAGAPAVDQSLSASPEPESPDPSQSSPLLASLDLSQPVSPDPESPSPPADSLAGAGDPLTSAEANPTPEQQAQNAADPTGDGPVERAKATETLMVNVEDDPPQ